MPFRWRGALSEVGTQRSAANRPTTGAVLRRFWLLNWLLTLAILACNFAEVRWMGWSTVVFVGAAWLEYAVIYLLLAFLPAFLLAFAVRRATGHAWLSRGLPLAMRPATLRPPG